MADSGHFRAVKVVDSAGTDVTSIRNALSASNIVIVAILNTTRIGDLEELA